MDLSQRSYKKELLDRNDIPFSDIKRNMVELNFINTYLGGHSITLTGLQSMLPAKNTKAVIICEIGCGGGDNLKAVAKWCSRKNIKASYIGVDINPDCIKVAKEACSNFDASFILADYRTVTFQQKPDIIFSSLFCHHFSNDELVQMLHWMRNNSTTGFFINDLHRHPVAFYLIKWLSRIFSKSYLVKHDAPLSVARGFSKREWLKLFHKAGIVDFNIEWKWAFRWLIVETHRQPMKER